MTEVTPITKADQLARSPGRENRRCETTDLVRRECKCNSCQGRRNRNKGKVGQLQVRKGMEKVFGVQAGPTVASTADEENWGGLPVRVEAKAGIKANAVGTFYRLTKAQSDAKKSIGNIKPFVAAAKVDGMGEPLYIIKQSDWIQLAEEARR